MITKSWRKRSKSRSKATREIMERIARTNLGTRRKRKRKKGTKRA